MKTKFALSIVALALAGVINSAQAEIIVLDQSTDFPYQLPQPGMGNDVYVVNAGATHSESFAFTLTDPYTNAIATVTPHFAPDLAGYFNWIMDANIRLFRGIPGKPAEIIAGTESFTYGSRSLESDYLPPGDYFWNISQGDLYGRSGRVYFFSADVMVIPEPETYALLLLGMGMIGFMARYGRKQAPGLSFA